MRGKCHRLRGKTLIDKCSWGKIHSELSDRGVDGWTEIRTGRYRECLKPPCSAAHFPRLGESRPKLNEINTRLMSNWGNSPATRVPHKQTHTISQPIVYLMTFMCLLWPSACVICRLFLTFLPFFRNEWARCHKTIWLKWFYRRLRGLKNKNEIKIRTPTAGDGAGNFTLLSVFSN